MQIIYLIPLLFISEYPILALLAFMLLIGSLWFDKFYKEIESQYVKTVLRLYQHLRLKMESAKIAGKVQKKELKHHKNKILTKNKRVQHLL